MSKSKYTIKDLEFKRAARGFYVANTPSGHYTLFVEQRRWSVSHQLRLKTNLIAADTTRKQAEKAAQAHYNEQMEEGLDEMEDGK